MRGRKTLLGLTLVVIPLAGVVWIRWDQLSTRYYAYRLAHAERGEAIAWVARGARHPNPEIRLQAVGLAMRPDVRHYEPVRALLSDATPEVRRAALLALGSAREVVADDELLPLLHDSDAAVRAACRTALRGRGLREIDVELGKLFGSPRIADRLQLLALLHDDGELDVSIWLQRLSQDTSPAVRAAAARAAGEQRVTAMRDRLAEMAKGDPDLTVRPIAQFHFRQLQQDRVQPAGGVIPD